MGHVAEQMSGMSRPFVDAVKKFKAELDRQLLTVAETKSILIAVKMDAMPNLDNHASGAELLRKTSLEEDGIEGDFSRQNSK